MPLVFLCTSWDLVTSFCRKSAIYLFWACRFTLVGFSIQWLPLTKNLSSMYVGLTKERWGSSSLESSTARRDVDSLRARDVGTKGRSKLRPGTGRGTHKFYETSKSKRAETFLFLDCRAETSIHDWISGNFREKDTRFLMAECVNVYLLGENLVCGAYQ